MNWIQSMNKCVGPAAPYSDINSDDGMDPRNQATPSQHGSPELQSLILVSLITKLHAAKGRYHTQLAACDLFDAVGLKNERPVK